MTILRNIRLPLILSIVVNQKSVCGSLLPLTQIAGFWTGIDNGEIYIADVEQWYNLQISSIAFLDNPFLLRVLLKEESFLGMAYSSFIVY